MKKLAITLVLVAGIAGVVISNLGQGRQQSGVLPVVKTFKAAKGVKDSTTRFKPQIVDGIRHVIERPENPLPPLALGNNSEAATAPHGENQAYQRIDNTNAARFPGIGATGWTPPDPNLAVGVNHIVETVNSSVAFFNKTTGQKTFQQIMDGAGGFFGSVGATDFVFDPKCYYDKSSGRFIVLALELQDPTISKLLIAVSDDGDPNGNWFKYRIEAALTVGSNTYWMDYPSLGVNKDALVVCGNMFAMSGSNGFAGVEFVVMTKAPMLTGGAPTVTVLRDENAGSGQCAQMADAVTDKVYAAAAESTSSIRLYGMTSLTSAPAITFQSVAVPGFTPRQRPSLSTNGRFLDNIDSRLYNVAWRNGKLVTAHHTQVSPSDDRSICRWYAFNTNNWPGAGTPTLDQSGDVKGLGGEDYHFPAMNINQLGDIGMIFARSSTNITADGMVTARQAGDAPGTMGQPVMVETSTNANYGSPGVNRWGDYYSTQVDPADDTTFWGVDMVSGTGGNWQTTIHSWSIANVLPPKDYDALTVTKYVGLSSLGGVADIRKVDGLYFSIISATMKGVGYAAGAEATYSIEEAATAVKSLKVTCTSRSTMATTGMVWLYNWSKNAYEHVGTFPLYGVGASTGTVTVSKNPGRFVKSTKEIKVLFRAHTPSRQAKPFSLSIDLMGLQVGPKG